MMHFDFQVGDLDSAVAEAVALGASLAAAQPQENVRAPAPRPGGLTPSCLCLDAGRGARSPSGIVAGARYPGIRAAAVPLLPPILVWSGAW